MTGRDLRTRCIHRDTPYRPRHLDVVVARDLDTLVYTPSSGKYQIVFPLTPADTHMLDMGHGLSE